MIHVCCCMCLCFVLNPCLLHGAPCIPCSHQALCALHGAPCIPRRSSAQHRISCTLHVALTYLTGALYNTSSFLYTTQPPRVFSTLHGAPCIPQSYTGLCQTAINKYNLNASALHHAELLFLFLHTIISTHTLCTCIHNHTQHNRMNVTSTTCIKQHLL